MPFDFPLPFRPWFLAEPYRCILAQLMEAETLVTCPQCGFQNHDQAIICQRCYALFGLRSDEPANTTVEVQADEAPRNEFGLSRNGRQLVPPLDTGMIALYIGDLVVPVVLQITRVAYLGRWTDKHKDFPLLDLTPFGAISTGVSRLHAALRRVGMRITLEDLHSSNGTYLNDIRLTPRRPTVLNTGDQLRLGKLPIAVLTGESEQGTH